MTNMHGMHERTGATEKQIEAAKDRIKDGTNLRLSYRSEATVELIAQALVPPGTVIVPEAVLTAAQAVVADLLGNYPDERIEELKAALDEMGGEG